MSSENYWACVGFKVLTTGLNHYILGPYLQGRSETIWQVHMRVHMVSKTSYKITFLLSFNTYCGSLQAFFQYKVISKRAFKTFFVELVLGCLQAQGEAPPLLLRKFRDVIHIKIFLFMYNVKSPRMIMKVAHLSSYCAVKSLFFSSSGNCGQKRTPK